MKQFKEVRTDISCEMLEGAIPINQGEEVREAELLIGAETFLSSLGFCRADMVGRWDGSPLDTPFVKDEGECTMYVVFVRTSNKTDYDDGMESYAVVMYSSDTDRFADTEVRIKKWLEGK